MTDQLDLFGAPPTLPEGFRYERDLLSAEEEEGLLAQIRGLPFEEFDFHGFKGKRRTVSYGWAYDFTQQVALRSEPLPEFLFPLRAKAAQFAGVAPESLEQTSVIEYAPGAPIGWHRDKRVFGDVIGISLLSTCQFRLRRRVGDMFERVTIAAEPRSIYLMSGASRSEWEHSIPPVEELRYSVVFRSIGRWR